MYILYLKKPNVSPYLISVLLVIILRRHFVYNVSAVEMVSCWNIGYQSFIGIRHAGQLYMLNSQKRGERYKAL